MDTFKGSRTNYKRVLSPAKWLPANRILGLSPTPPQPSPGFASLLFVSRHSPRSSSSLIHCTLPFSSYAIPPRFKARKAHCIAAPGSEDSQPASSDNGREAAQVLAGNPSSETQETPHLMQAVSSPEVKVRWKPAVLLGLLEQRPS
jgi:hypothetical protein